MTIWLVLALMTAAAILAVAWPLVRTRAKARSGSDLAGYRDQLEEMQRDRSASIIGEAEAEAASIEVSRRLLAAADAQAAPAAPADTKAMRRAAALAALVVLSLGTGSLYLVLGSPSLTGQALSARNENPSIDGLIAQVEDHLARNPTDGRGWDVIAPIYLRLGRFDDAVKARRKALALNGETSERLAGLGEALAGAAEGRISGEAKASFQRAVALDAENVKARYYLGIAAEQDGRPAEAAATW